MKKKIYWLIPLVILGLFLLFLLFYYPSYKENQEKEKLLTELNTLTKYIEPNNLNLEAISSLIKEDITTTSYQEVEDALENYIIDLATTLNSTYIIINDNQLVNLLTVTNYQHDGPEFQKSKAYITTSLNNLTSNKNKIISFSKEANIKKYLQTSSKRNKELFISLIKEIKISSTEAKNLTTAIDKITDILNISYTTLDFLSQNSTGWYLENNQILFTTSELLNTYNNFVAKIG